MEVRDVRKNLMNSILKMDKSHLRKFHFLKVMISNILSIHTIKILIQFLSYISKIEIPRDPTRSPMTHQITASCQS